MIVYKITSMVLLSKKKWFVFLTYTYVGEFTVREFGC